MIKSIFPVNVLIKDDVLTEVHLKELESVVSSCFHQKKIINEISYEETGNDCLDLFTDENLKNYESLRVMRKELINSFFELSESYEEGHDTIKHSKESIDKFLKMSEIKVPFMQNKMYKKIHNHVGSIAIGVFYFQDVNNDKDGGQLILNDPSFHANYGFHSPNEFCIDTVKNRLCVFPAYVWHQVIPYIGDKERRVMVIHLDNMIR